jgi:serine protease Do
MQAMKASYPFSFAASSVRALLLGSAVIAAFSLPSLAQEELTVFEIVNPDDTRPMSFADLAEEVSPAVVNITTSMVVAGNLMPDGMAPPGSPFEEFFNEFGGDNMPRRENALGSGFIISSDGYVVTNNHVIENAEEIMIELFSHEELPATVIGTDPKTDIALLKVDATDLPYVEFGDSNGDGARVGDWVMAIGNPLGRGFSVSAGIVSARERALGGRYDDYIQTDAAINQGNSGGPLFNMAGEVIGVNTAILSPTGGSIGIGFAMSSEVVEKVVYQLREFGETRRGRLGVTLQPVTPDMVGAIAGLESPEGALVTDVPDGPALDAGVQIGDVILSFDGNPVPDTRELVQMVGDAAAGDVVLLEILRNGERITLTVTLDLLEEDRIVQASSETTEPESADVLGLELSAITPELSQQFGIAETEGLVVTSVDPMSDAGEKGIMPGSVITEAGQQPVRTVSDLTDRIEEAREAGRKSLLLLIRQQGDPRFVALAIGED